MLAVSRETFAHRLLAWFDQHGRRDLPWQHPRSPYAVWISEIMLQQTQVTTVIPYFERFMARFPDVKALADASLDDVLQTWAGLGYYSRARNLQRAAGMVRDQWQGMIPADVAALLDLPGIGRSTAGAIASLGFGMRAPILDGNVKRVLTRYHGIDGWPGDTGVSRKLWSLAEASTPDARVADYTQAIMDLGATVCVKRQPRCPECPLRDGCGAYAEGRTHEIPASKPAKKLRTVAAYWLMRVSPDLYCLLEKNPPMGLWGGLWVFPSFASVEAIASQARTEGFPVDALEWLPARRHTFSHFHLDYTPVLMRAERKPAVAEPNRRWVALNDAEWPAMPTPAANLLNELKQECE